MLAIGSKQMKSLMDDDGDGRQHPKGGGGKGEVCLPSIAAVI
jgi:hypothetical protein